ncbi:MAG: NADH-quinone oxidoreductase subunit L [Smithellaceae bacterium]|nr:NADH-quinone oxidoreductase subunit L [Smithellaceae bacterium]
MVPLAGFLILAIFGRRLSQREVAFIGVGSAGSSALISISAAVFFISARPAGGGTAEVLWRWFAVGRLAPSFALYLDPLSLVMVLVVSIVGFLILLYAKEYMIHEEGYARFFAYMDLFVGSMLLLVLADDLLLIYLGWEAVGLCSYLLIGFDYHDRGSVAAANKAFIVTRIGDTALLLGFILIFLQLGTSNLREVLTVAPQSWPAGSSLACWAALLILGGAVGKSAQLPLQTWLPDAMAGPTPVSALIHAATMVTAGVYLIARTHVLFALAPSVMSLTAFIGIATMLLAATAALTQSDIKKVLAYSTMSQIGYMFLALGVGAWSAAIFHFVTHAFFKSLLFLAAGVVIAALGGERDLYKMGGLRRQQPLAFWTFLIGAASLAALPLITAGFYSKELILAAAWNAGPAGVWLWSAATIGAFLTGLYAFRMVILCFFGPPRVTAGTKPGRAVAFVLVVLAFFSLTIGFIQMPAILARVDLFLMFLADTLPARYPVVLKTSVALMLLAAAIIVPPLGSAVARFLFLLHRGYTEKAVRRPVVASARRLWKAGWGFDYLYDHLFVRPFAWLAIVNRGDFIDSFYGGISRLSALLAGLSSATQTGVVRRYALGVTLGAVVVLGLVLVF